MNVIWDGVIEAKDLSAERVETRKQLADASRGGTWNRIFELLLDLPETVNSCRLGGKSHFAPLHQAAYLVTRRAECVGLLDKHQLFLSPKNVLHS